MIFLMFFSVDLWKLYHMLRIQYWSLHQVVSSAVRSNFLMGTMKFSMVFRLGRCHLKFSRLELLEKLLEHEIWQTGKAGSTRLSGFFSRPCPHIWFGWLKELLAGQATCKYPCPFQKYHKYEQTLLPSVQAPTLTPESSYITILFIYVHYCWDIAEIISTIVVLFQMGRRVENTHSETREVP